MSHILNAEIAAKRLTSPASPVSGKGIAAAEIVERAAKLFIIWSEANARDAVHEGAGRYWDARPYALKVGDNIGLDDIEGARVTLIMRGQVYFV